MRDYTYDLPEHDDEPKVVGRCAKCGCAITDDKIYYEDVEQHEFFHGNCFWKIFKEYD